MKITTTITYFKKKVGMKINPIHNIFKWIFVYYKCYIMAELTFLKELMLIKQVHQKSMIFVTIGIFLIKGFKFQPNVCNRCHDLLIMSVNIRDIAISRDISIARDIW